MILIQVLCIRCSVPKGAFSHMITQNIKESITECVCPECKNPIDLAAYPNMAEGMVIECNHCGMTLLVKSIESGAVKTEIVDEGK